MLKTYLTLTVVVLVPLACLAADTKAPMTATAAKPLFLKPGLWQTSMSTQVSRATPITESELAKLPPDQRSKVQAFGKSVESGGRPQNRTFTSCITQQDLSKPFAIGDERPGSCKRTLVASSSTRQEIRIECTRGQATSVGDMHIQVVDPAEVKGTSQMKSTSGGVSMDVKISFDSRWVAAACPARK